MQDKTVHAALKRNMDDGWIPNQFSSSRVNSPSGSSTSYVFSDAYVLQVCGLRAQRICPLVAVLVPIDSFGAPSALHLSIPSHLCSVLFFCV